MAVSKELMTTTLSIEVESGVCIGDTISRP